MNRFLTFSLALFLILSCTACVGRAAAPAGGELPAAEPQEVAAPQPVEPEPAGEPEEPEEPPVPEPEEPYVRAVDPSKPMVALTFDDGPHDTWSNAILDVLEENHALATFFEVGRNVRAHPEPVQRMAELGCEVASHSNAHKDLSKLKKKTLIKDLDTADAAFTDAGVEPPALVRPPYGAVNKNVKSATGRSIVTWTVDTEDWRSRDAQAVIDYVQNYGDLDGEIVLMHSIYESTADAVKVLVPWLQEQGYQLVTVTELLAYYYGELPQPDRFYGYSYFSSHGRTDTPVPLPGETVPGAGVPAEEPVEEAPDAPAEEPAAPADEPEAPAESESPAEEAPAEADKDWKPVRVPDTVDLAPASIPNPALFIP